MKQLLLTGICGVALALLAIGCKPDEPDPPLAEADVPALDDAAQPPDVPPAPDATTPDDGADAAASDGLVTYTEEREPCQDRNPHRNVYWGDTHIHTAFSFDAFVYDTRLTPADAYRFAKGEEVMLPPLGADGKGTRPVTLARPLDFVAVSDHAEFLGEVEACTDSTSAAYDSLTCVEFRKGGPDGIAQFGFAASVTTPERLFDVCGEGAADCPSISKGVWARIREEAEGAYDRSSACSFTSFVAYEYSGSPGISNYHRNVIFRNEKVPELPTSYFEEPTAVGLWTALEKQCLSGTPGCDVLAIPHNPNWSNGLLFHVEYPGADTPEEKRAHAELRSRMEPLVEIFQHKGDSECMNGFASVLGDPDELCDFEKLRPMVDDDCGDEVGSGAMIGLGCTSRLDFVRNVLKEGLAQPRARWPKTRLSTTLETRTTRRRRC